MSLQDQVAASVTESSKRQLQATLETVQAHTAAVMDQAARRIRSTGGIPPKEAEDAMRQVEEAKREVARALKEAHEELDSKLAEAFGKLPVGDRERRSSSPPTKKEAPPMKRS
jgi:DNA-binding ferritin-like protein